MALKSAFLGWLERLASRRGKDVDGLMKRLRHVKSGTVFTRDEMNAR